jgi:hypothetical protein
MKTANWTTWFSLLLIASIAGWITRARLTATRHKRLKQMLDELKKGNVYMKMKWNFK